MECPYCKKTLEITVAQERPWWRQPGCVFSFAIAIVLVIWSLFFSKNEQSTKQDIAAQNDKITALEKKIDKLIGKWDKMDALLKPLGK